MFKIPAKDRIWEINEPQIMAILNATPDSFYEGSRILDPKIAIQKTGFFIAQGANIIDIGGQSTRPGATPMDAKNEINKVVPIIEAIHDTYPSILISIDTFNSKVAAAALKAGAHIVNDISCGKFDDNILTVVSNYNAGYIGMYLTGDINSMHTIAETEDLVQDIILFFEHKKKYLANKGINQWVIDPGFGFGKTIPNNFLLVKQLAKLTTINLPILLGVSRKSSIYKTLQTTANNALNGTTIVNTIGVLNGAQILRVHDVLEAKEVLTLMNYLK